MTKFWLEFWIEWIIKERGIAPLFAVWRLHMIETPTYHFVFLDSELIIMARRGGWVYPVGSYFESLFRPIPQEAAPHATKS